MGSKNVIFCHTWLCCRHSCVRIWSTWASAFSLAAFDSLLSISTIFSTWTYFDTTHTGYLRCTCTEMRAHKKRRYTMSDTIHALTSVARTRLSSCAILFSCIGRCAFFAASRADASSPTPGTAVATCVSCFIASAPILPFGHVGMSPIKGRSK